MIVVADATPLHYLTLIGAIHVLLPLYERVLVPKTVAAELQQAKTPAAVQAWMTQPPAWCEIHPDPPLDLALMFLDAGERAAITLALAVHADGLLIDELQGRAAAARRQLHVTGTLGVLGDAHLAGLLDFETALAQLCRTNFYISDVIVDGLRQRLARVKGNV